MSFKAVVFDLDGVIVDTEEVWDRERRAYVAAHGGAWRDGATGAMQGMSSAEWSRYLRDELGAEGEPEEISRAVAALVVAEVQRELPLLPGAVRAVNALAADFTLALASSANREVIDAVLDGAAITERFATTISSEEVERGKPAPDVYLEAARRLGVQAERCAAIEDSHNGIRSAKAAGMRTIAIPNPRFPPGDEALAEADVVLGSLDELAAGVVRGE